MGAQTEFMEVGEFKPVQQMCGGGVFNLPKGVWTDDTSLMLATLDSLTPAFDEVLFISNALLYKNEGKYHPLNNCVDIGTGTSHALEEYAAVKSSLNSKGNGVLTRLYPLIYFNDLDLIKSYTFLTHRNQDSLKASYLLFAILKALYFERVLFDSNAACFVM